MAIDKQAIIAFLKSQGFKNEEIKPGTTNVTDKLARDYGEPKDVQNRYVLGDFVSIRTTDVDLVKKATGELGELIKKGIIISGDPQFYYTRFAELRPQMIAEATKSARQAALQFANDSGAHVGHIRSANQGAFSISGKDSYGDNHDYSEARTWSIDLPLFFFSLRKVKGRFHPERVVPAAGLEPARPYGRQILNHLGIEPDKIPDFRELSDILTKATGWKIVAVEGHLDQLDYLQEPDIFHDIYGHVPLLIQPIFADYMEAYGKAGLKALGNHSLHYLARLYWYTVEFGLINTPKGLRIYGSGITSSAGESKYCLESPKPNRLWFDSTRF
eukprot:gene17771-17989_t